MTDASPTNPDANQRLWQRHSKIKITVSRRAAFALVILAVILSVLVGVLVHLTSSKSFVCSWDTPVAGNSESSAAKLNGQCLELIVSGDKVVCAACPKSSTSSPAALTSPATPFNLTSPTTATTPSNTTPSTTSPSPVINYRLPAAVKPHHYTLKLQPEIYGQNSSSFTFNGSVSIILNVTQATSNITLHKKDLTISHIISLKVIEDPSVTAPKIINTSYEEVTHFYVIHLDSDLDPLYSYDLSMTFDGKIRTDGTGLYLSSYKDDNNETVYLASTHFEAPDARKAFPCFDEPAQKATFDITLVRKATTGRNYRTLANTDVLRNETWGEYVADVYATTPRMSTYLLAFVVCDFDQYENRTSNVTYRTIVRPNGLQFATRAHQYGLDLFHWYANTFQPSFPLSKLDNIVIPGFKSGAMENWGLIIYREDLLYIPGITRASLDGWTGEVISHEIAHQWFGNIVSPKWWWWLWLNEAFATFWAHWVMEALHPERRSMEQFLVQSAHAAMSTDSVRTSHPMTTNVESHDDVEDSFDRITYRKGACIVRMMDFIMGRETFLKGLNIYLTRHQFGVAEHQDLWDALTESIMGGTFINMTDIMDPWVTQMNFPLVTVRVVGPGELHVKQERFLKNMTEDTSADTALYNYRWTIPITIASQSNSSNFNKVYEYSDIAWLQKTESEVILQDPVVPDPADKDNWVVVNFLLNGFYRVNYDDANWRAILKQLEVDHTVFPPMTRAQLINDAWALQRAGRVQMVIALRTLNFLKNETDYVPWRAFHREIGTLDRLLDRSEVYGAFKEFMEDLTQLTYDRWGLNVTDDIANINVYQLNRGALYACKYGVTNCVEDSLRMFRNWMRDEKKRLDPNVRKVIICNAVKYGGVPEWNFAFRQYWNSDIKAIKEASLEGLACTRQPWLLERMLSKSLDKQFIARQDTRDLISNVNSNPLGRELTWSFVKSHFSSIEKYLGSRTLQKIITDLDSNFNTQFYVKEIHELLKSEKFVKYKTSLQTALRTAESNVRWLDENEHVVSDWLVEKGYGDYLPSQK